MPNSGQEVWWKCKHGHEWRKSVRDRVQGCACPYCQEKLPVVGKTDLATLCKNLVDYWNYKKNKKFQKNTSRIARPVCGGSVIMDTASVHLFVKWYSVGDAPNASGNEMPHGVNNNDTPAPNDGAGVVSM